MYLLLYQFRRAVSFTVFRLVDHAEVNGTVYAENCSHLSKSVFKKPLSKLINRLLAHMHKMDLISDAHENSFYNFLYEYYRGLRYFNL